MTVTEIKQALEKNLKVYWSHDGYEVRKDNIGQYLIVYKYPYHAIGLTNKDGNLNCDPSKFYIERKVKKMLNINGKKYAKNEKEFSQSLFNKGGTCDGYYKVKRKKNKTLVLLTDAKGEEFAYVVKTNKGEYSIGTKHKEYYMYDLTDYHRRKLGIEDLGYSETIDLAESIINQIK